MLDMNLQSFSHLDPTPTPIPNGLPDKPGPKLVSAKGKVEHIVVVLLGNGEDLKAATQRVLEDGNVPAVAVTEGLMTWNGNSYIGFVLKSATALGVYVGTFDEQGVLKITEYTATIAAASN